MTTARNYSNPRLSVEAIPAFQDNYIWLIRGTGTACAVVDPGDHRPVQKVLRDRGLNLCYILLTHHHADHTGGAAELAAENDALIIGPEDKRIESCDRRVRQDDEVSLPALGLQFRVMEVPAHTRSHIAFYGHDMLFSGDTLFSVGCGRLFEGTPEQMQDAMDKFAALPEHTKVYCGHEYTLSNCMFAQKVEPENTDLEQYTARIRALREKGQISLPSTLATELKCNPFMRTRVESVVAAAGKLRENCRPGAETMAVIRSWKDNG